MKKTLYSAITMIVILGWALTACVNQQTPSTQDDESLAGTAEAFVSSDEVIAEGHLIPARDTTLSFQAMGTVVSVEVETGDQVK